MTLAFCGLALLALSMERHFELVFPVVGGKARRLACGILGWLLVGLAAAPAIHEDGLSVGLAVWAGELSLAAAGVLLLLSYAPKAIPWLVLLLPMLALMHGASTP